jgi:hypothetical protein
LSAAANDSDLAALNYMVTQLPTLKSMVSNLRMASTALRQVDGWQAQQRLRRNTGGDPLTDGCPSVALTPTDLTIVNVILDVTGLFNQIFPDSFTIEIFGAAITIPISPIKAIFTVLYVAAWAAQFGVSFAWNFYTNCLSDNEENMGDTLTNFLQENSPRSQVQLAVTPIDVSHYIIAAHLNGQPVAITTGGISLQTTVGPASSTGQQTLALITGGVPINVSKQNAASLCGAPTSSTITQVALCQINGTDAGLYELFIPPSLAGTSYRLQVDDGTKCTTGPFSGWTGTPGQGFPDSLCDHYGTSVFTKATNS